MSNSRKLGREALDFGAHAGSAFLLLTAAWLCGVWFSPAGAVLVAWAPGFVREFTEWQDGGRHPFTPAGLLDQAGWITGGVAWVALFWSLDL